MSIIMSTKLASLRVTLLRKSLALAFTLLLATLAFSASPALAETHPFVTSFGSFTNPNGIAVEESTGDVYVADIGTNTVSKFDANGNFLAKWGSPGAGLGQFAGIWDVAVGPGNTVWVTDANRVQ